MTSDLVIVVADGGIEQAIRGMLTRPKAIGIRPLSGVEFPKLHRLDQGVYASGHEIASLYRETHRHALVVLDLEWERRPTDDAGQMVEDVERRLHRDWGDKGRCVVIAPELEVWIWSDSPHVASALGWDSFIELRGWLEKERLWQSGESKPSNPKQAYLRAIKRRRIQRSNATFRALAEKVGFDRCRDASFLRLLGILRGWFPVADATGHQNESNL